MTGKRLRKLLSVLALGALLVRPAAAQLEGPVEQGLAQLASQIVTKSKAAGKAAIAVLPFPNADGSCSVLSNFIADELIQSLFSVPGSGLEIVERSQLETVIKELKLGASGLLNPETTKKLGSQSGVSALIVGTITVIGDTVRINARLIATDTGKAISAAAVDVPKIAAVNELLKQPITAGPTCAPLSEDGKKSKVPDVPGHGGKSSPIESTNVGNAFQALQGTWEGTYVCGQGETGVRLSLDPIRDQNVIVLFEFYPIPNNTNAQRGSYMALGRFDEHSSEISVYPAYWVQQPSGYGMLRFTARFNPQRQSLQGSIDFGGCQTILVYKVG